MCNLYFPCSSLSHSWWIISTSDEIRPDNGLHWEGTPGQKETGILKEAHPWSFWNECMYRKLCNVEKAT